MKQKPNIETKINSYLKVIEKRTMFIKECHTTWWYLISKNEDRGKILDIYNKYLEFFEVTRVSLFTTIMVYLSTLFDEDCDSITFKNLIKIVNQKDEHFLSKSINYNELHKKGRKLYKYRSKDIAHCDQRTLKTDFLKETNLTYNDLKSMIDDCRKLIEEIYAFCNRTIPTYISTKSDINQLVMDLSNMNKNDT